MKIVIQGNRVRLLWVLPVLLCFALSAISGEHYSPPSTASYPTNVYFGDTHLHTNLSMDSYLFGNKNLDLEQAYRFARGELVTDDNGMKVKLNRPLDFLVIADHARNIGALTELDGDSKVLLNTKIGKRWHTMLRQAQKADSETSSSLYNELLMEGIYSKSIAPPGGSAFKRSIWKRVIGAAETFNKPGEFTAFIGYEWTSWGPVKFGNLHRVVVFKDNADKVNQVVPFSSFDSDRPEDLWQFFEDYRTKTGGDVLAIPHNSNQSNGQMFTLEDSDKRPFSQSYAKTRSRWEPLVEVTQIKGDSEAHPLLSPSDEFADYETWEGKISTGSINKWSEEEKENKKYEYVRSALKEGLAQKEKLGVNPFKFGVIGSTDAHTSLATADENNFWGKVTQAEPKASRVMSPGIFGWNMNAAGYAAIWAEENTRESLFDAMKRKEVYATTGPRMTVRFFGGWNYHDSDSLHPDLAKIGYTKGVPMGGDITHAPKDESPSFLIRAVKDPDGGNLDRVQVVKGWQDKQGTLHEKVYNVALSDGRKVRRNGKVKSVGSTVDIKNASYINTIGDPELSVVWTDPDFNKDEHAFYYVRVLEIPTPRWTAYDAKFFNVKDIPEDVQMVTQERAYTSPIWYVPGEKAKTL